jgi:TIR domain
VFVSSAYVKKNWTKHELKHAQARSFESEREYILPLRIDDTVLPGLAPTIGYLDLRQHHIAQVGLLLLDKLGLSSDNLMEEAARAKWEGDFVEYNGTKVASFWPAQLEASQRKPFVLVTRAMDRIRFGKETWWKMKKVISPCHDCAAVVGQLHGPGCDMEQCPACLGQWIGCGCRHDTVTEQQATAWEEQEDEISD